MTTRACDFSSFKRPAKPLNTSSVASSHSSEKTSSLRSNELDVSREYPGEFTHRKLSTSLSVDPSMTQRANFDYLGGSTSTFKDTTSPTISPAQLYSFSSQNVDGYTSFQRAPHVNHSTIDRTTLPYDRRHKAPPKFTPSVPRHEESGVGSGLVFLDGGRRGVMNAADSQHSLDDSLSGHRIDRSLAKGRNGPEAVDNYNTVPYEPAEYPPGNHGGNRTGYVPNGGMNPYGYYTTQNRMNMEANALPPNNGTYGYQGNIGRGSHPNMSSGESGIAGCDYNTLGMTYEACGDAASYGDYRYNGTTAAGRPPPRPYKPEQQRDIDDDADDSEEHRQNQSNENLAGDNERSGGGSGNDEITQRTLLVQADSAVQFGSDMPETMQDYDQNASFAMGSGYKSSIKNSSVRKTSKPKSKMTFNPFKKKSKKSTDDIYKRNNLYGTKRKSSKQNTQVTLGSGGLTTTGISFNKSAYTSTKRPFCPRWPCIALAVAIGVMILICASFVVYFYVWPTVLQPLVESSKPIDGEWGSWRPWFECSVTCGKGVQNRTRECDSPSPEDGGQYCEGKKHEMRACNAPVECPDCSRICEVGTLSRDCRSCTCEGHVITGTITDEKGKPLPGVKVYKGSGAALLLAGTNNEGEFEFEGVCSNGDNELRLEKNMYRVSRVQPVQSKSDKRVAHVSFSMTKLFLPVFVMPPTDEKRIANQKVVLCCVAQSEQPPTRYTWYKDNSMLDPRLYHYSLENPSLILPELMEWDGGKYACEVENEAGTVKSDPADLTVYRNWTDICNPIPKDNYIELPEGCKQRTFNTGSCGSATAHSSSEAAEPTTSSERTYSKCITNDQYPNDSPNNVCNANSNAAALRNKYCCKPTAEEEVKVQCKIKDGNFAYEMSLKRTLSCGCELCD